MFVGNDMKFNKIKKWWDDPDRHKKTKGFEWSEWVPPLEPDVEPPAVTYDPGIEPIPTTDTESIKRQKDYFSQLLKEFELNQMQQASQQSAMASSFSNGSGSHWWDTGTPTEGKPEAPAEEKPKVDTSKVFDYEEPEESEFDEECIPTCRIGDHKCGKSNG